MPKTWSAKRERQYEHIKESLTSQGRSKKVAEEIAARTVNKERARAGEARQASPTSVNDISSSRRVACVRTRVQVAAPRPSFTPKPRPKAFKDARA